MWPDKEAKILERTGRLTLKIQKDLLVRYLLFKVDILIQQRLILWHFFVDKRLGL